IIQRSTSGEGQLYHLLVGLSRADDPGVGPHGHARTVRGLDPFAVLHDVRGRFMDEATNLRQGFPTPVTQRPDTLVDEARYPTLRCRVWLRGLARPAPARHAPAFRLVRAPRHRSPLLSDYVDGAEPGSRPGGPVSRSPIRRTQAGPAFSQLTIQGTPN